MWQSGECGISQYLAPTREIDLGRRIQVRQLDGDRHDGKYAKKRKQ